MPNEHQMDQLRDLVKQQGLANLLLALARIAEAVPPEAQTWRRTAALHLRTCSELVE